MRGPCDDRLDGRGSACSVGRADRSAAQGTPGLVLEKAGRHGEAADLLHQKGALHDELHGGHHVSPAELVRVGEEILHLEANQSTYIPLGEKHRLENPGSVPLEIIEVQSGSYLGEDDIVRFDDVYQRHED